MTVLQELTSESLLDKVVRIYRKGGGSRPEVAIVELDGREVVLKDFARCDPWFSRILGARLARREAIALQRLDSVAGVPKLLARIGKQALLMEHVPSRNVKEYTRGELPEEVITRLLQLVADMHQYGVAHCDLRSFGNILVDEYNQPHLVDFTAHFKQGKSWNPVTRWLFKRFCMADFVAIARVKRRHAPDMLSEAEKLALQKDRKTILERGARMFGKSVRNVSRWLLTRRKS